MGIDNDSPSSVFQYGTLYNTGEVFSIILYAGKGTGREREGGTVSLPAAASEELGFEGIRVSSRGLGQGVALCSFFFTLALSQAVAVVHPRYPSHGSCHQSPA